MNTTKRYLEVRTETTCFDGTTVTTYAEVPVGLDEAAEWEHCWRAALEFTGYTNQLERASVREAAKAEIERLRKAGAAALAYLDLLVREEGVRDSYIEATEQRADALRKALEGKT